MDENAGSERDERLLTAYSGRLLIGVSLGWAFVQGGRLLLSPLLPEISAELNLSSTRAGFAITVIWGLYALLQYPSGRLSDELTRKTLLVVSLVLSALGFAAIAGAPTYLAFLGAAVITGLGVGLYPTPARGLVSDLFVSRRGQAFGIHTASGDLGGVMAASVATVIVAVATWRAAFPPVVFVLLLVALSLHLWGREEYVVERVDLAVTDTGRRLFVDAESRWLLFGYALFAFSWQAATAFLPTFIRVGKELSPAVANTGFAVLFVVGVIVKPLAGNLADRFSRALLAPVVLVFAAMMLVVVIYAAGPLTVTLSVACFAAGLLAFPPVMQAYLMDSFPTDSMGGDLGAMRSAYIGFGATGPLYVGVVADVFDYDIAFAGLVCCLLASAFVLLYQRSLGS